MEFWDKTYRNAIDWCDIMLNFLDNIETNWKQINEQIQNLTNKFSLLTEKNSYEDILTIETFHNDWLSYSDIIDLKKEAEKFLEVINSDSLDKDYYENREIKKELDEQYSYYENFEEEVKDLLEAIDGLIDMKEKKEKMILKK